jgi:hypothetical protein
MTTTDRGARAPEAPSDVSDVSDGSDGTIESAGSDSAAETRPSPSPVSETAPAPASAPAPATPAQVNAGARRRLPLRQAWRTFRSLLHDGIRGLGALVSRLFGLGEDWLLDRKRASYGLAITRMLLGVTILGTLVSNFTTRLYTFGGGAAWTGQLDYPTSEFARLWPFNIFPSIAANDFAFTELYLLLGVCAVLFTIGYRTRIVMIPLFILWVGFVEINEYVSDQSDNLTRMALIAIFFASPAERWSMDARRRRRNAGRAGIWPLRLWRFQRVLPEWSTNLSHNLAIIVLACQVSFIYVSGGLYKAGGEPWSGGWAIYDPIHVAQFGTWPELSSLVTTWAPGVAFATILTLLVQVSFPLLLLRRGTRIFALVVMLSFHIGIAVLMGLPWFSLAMIAIDSIFIRDVTWRHMSQGLRRAWLRSDPQSAHIQEK